MRTAGLPNFRKLYGRIMQGVAIEALSWTLTIAKQEGREPPVRRGRQPLAAHCPEGAQPAVSCPAPIGRQALFDPASARSAEARVYLRDGLPPGAEIGGPALITEEQTTTVVPLAWCARIDDRGSIVLTRRETADG